MRILNVQPQEASFAGTIRSSADWIITSGEQRLDVIATRFSLDQALMIAYVRALVIPGATGRHLP